MNLYFDIIPTLGTKALEMGGPFAANVPADQEDCIAKLFVVSLS